LDRQKLVIAGSQLAAPLTIDFPSGVVFDIDIVDLESFDTLLSNFIEQSQLTPGNILLFISPSVYYEKNVALSSDQNERQSQIDTLLETIPFKNLIYKDYIFGTSPKLVIFNKNFYEPVAKFFEKNNFNILAIMPTFVLDNFHLALTTFLPKEVKDIYQKYKLIEPFSVISAQDIDKIVTTTIHRPKEDNTRTYILLGIFCFLFIVLLGYIYLAPKLYKPPVRKIVAPVVENIIAPTPIITETTPTPAMIYLAPEVIKIKVINSSGVPNQAAKIKTALVNIGFVDIKTLSSSQITSNKNQVSFSNNISPDAQQKIFEAVNSIAGPSLKVDYVNSKDYDVLITTTSKPPTQTTP